MKKTNELEFMLEEALVELLGAMIEEKDMEVYSKLTKQPTKEESFKAMEEYKLKIENKDLQDTINTLKQNSDKLRMEVKGLSSYIVDKNEECKNLKKENQKLKKKLSEAVKNFNLANDHHQSCVAILEGQNNLIEELVKENEELRKEKISVKKEAYSCSEPKTGGSLRFVNCDLENGKLYNKTPQVSEEKIEGHVSANTVVIGNLSAKTAEKKFAVMEKEAMEIIKMMHLKAKDYGNSFEKINDRFGLIGAVIPLNNKVDRITSIVENNGPELKTESLEDSIKDLIGYSLMTLAYIKK